MIVHFQQVLLTPLEWYFCDLGQGIANSWFTLGTSSSLDFTCDPRQVT